MTTSLAKCLAGSLICFTAIAVAKDMPSYSSEFYPSAKQHSRVAVRHIEGGGIGYNKGYTTLEGFFAPDPDSLILMPFLDLRGHIFDNGKIAANGGAGIRKIAGSRVYGLNAYYDYRNTKKIHYNQIGFGLETLGSCWDFRINGYFPIGKKITCPFGTKFIGFQGHNMILSQKYQFAMRGANAEFGFHFKKTRFFDFYAAAGPYYFNGKIGPQIWGGKGRLTARYKDYLTIELSNSYDKVFHNRFQCQFTFTLPFGGQSHMKQMDDYHSCDISNMLSSRMVQPVTREEIIVSNHREKCTAAIDPTTDKPFNFVFVDNTSHSDGTYESPYPNLFLAQTNSAIGDIIYVFPGNGTTQGMDEGIVLQRNQKFWGSGVSHVIHTAQGDFIIPVQSSSAPKMTNTTGDGITLSSINQVSGFTLTNVAGNGIVGTNAEKIEISDCTIDHSTLDQIHLESTGSRANATLNNLVIANGVQTALFINSTASSLACAMNNCIIKDNLIFAIDATCANQTNFSLTNNVFEQNGDLGGGGGTALINFAGPATLAVSNNIFNNATSINLAPIFITAGANSLSATIENNSINANACGAMHFVLNNTDSAQLNVNNNTITNNGFGSIGSQFGSALFINPNGTASGNCHLNVMNNNFSTNGASCLYCANGNFNDFRVNATDNTMINNGGSGCVFANGCNTFMLNAKNNIISHGGDHGITTGGGLIIGAADMTISNNQIIGNTGFANAIAISHAGNDLNLIVTDNDMSDNQGSGIIMYSSDVIENVAVNIENNTINNNQNTGSNVTGGIDLEQYANLSGSILNNTLLNNVGPGLFIGTTQASPSVCLTMTGNNSNTGYTLSNGTGIFNLAPCDVNTVNTGTITPIGAVTIVQSCPDAVPCT